jgi:hypothetical protein
VQHSRPGERRVRRPLPEATDREGVMTRRTVQSIAAATLLVSGMSAAAGAPPVLSDARYMPNHADGEPRFGASVAMEANTVLVGAPLYTVGIGAWNYTRGAVYKIDFGTGLVQSPITLPAEPRTASSARRSRLQTGSPRSRRRISAPDRSPAAPSVAARSTCSMSKP